jgi:hypothetical protein
MNTMDEIREAMADYRAGRMGRLKLISPPASSGSSSSGTSP